MSGQTSQIATVRFSKFCNCLQNYDIIFTQNIQYHSKGLDILSWFVNVTTTHTVGYFQSAGICRKTTPRPYHALDNFSMKHLLHETWTFRDLTQQYSDNSNIITYAMFCIYCDKLVW